MKYHNISYPDQNNGDGLRVVLWLSACDHRCYKCQNPQTWDENSGIDFDLLAKKELLQEIENDYISGLTLSGGDPLHKNNLHEVLNLITEIKTKFPTKTIWLYTGYTWDDIFLDKYWNLKLELDKEDYKTHGIFESDDMLRRLIISQCDVLVDGPYIDSQRNITLKWRGSKNQRVIDVKESLKKEKIVLWTD